MRAGLDLKGICEFVSDDSVCFYQISSVSGYSQKLGALLSVILDRLVECSFTAEQFAVQHERLVEYYKVGFLLPLWTTRSRGV